MAYSLNMEQAAVRHYDDGCKLLDAKRYDNAGYHFGLAAECAVKYFLQAMGVQQKDESLWQHFPELRATALQSISGRSAASLRRLLDHDNFMQYWDIRMRYAPTGSIEQNIVERWRTQANEAIGLLL